jgi:hypothetical protein
VAKATYDEVYALYRHLHDHFGRERVAWMHTLKALRRRAAVQGEPATVPARVL